MSGIPCTIYTFILKAFTRSILKIDYSETICVKKSTKEVHEKLLASIL